jgi:hypothetical protein
MRPIPVRSVFIVLLAAFAVAAARPPQATPVLISVTEPAGEGVANAHVRVVPAPDPAPARMDTDSKGHLSLSLKPGGYALFVNSAGFAGIATHIEVRASGETQTIPVALQIAPSSPPVKVLPTSEKDDLLLTLYPFHDDVLIKPVDFKALPHSTLTIHNPHTNADETYSGVPLADLLAKYGAPLGKELRGVALACYLVASGSDGYQAVFSLAELDPSFHPGEVLVADAMNGQPLDAKTGPFRMVASEDKRPARSVRNLVAIELKLAR